MCFCQAKITYMGLSFCPLGTYIGNSHLLVRFFRGVLSYIQEYGRMYIIALSLLGDEGRSF